MTLELRGIDPSSAWVHASGLQPGETPRIPYTATWDIRLIHARGVACGTITLP